jgi:predicted nucleotidyltransferase
MGILGNKLTAEEQAKLIERLYAQIISLVTPNQVILFGSASRGEMTDASDLDIVVIVQDISEVKSTQKSLNQLSRLLQWPVDCLVVDMETFNRKSAIGGVYFVAKEEGRQLA